MELGVGEWAVLGAVEAIGLLCFVPIWVKRRTVAAKLFWSIVVFIPLIGPLLFGALASGLSAQGEADQAQESSWIRYDHMGGFGGGDDSAR